MTTRILIAHYSTYGTNAEMAQAAVQALSHDTAIDLRQRRFAETAPQSVVESQDAWASALENQRHVPVLTPEDIDWADGILFSFPTRFGAAPSQVRAFIDTLGGLWAEGKTANKAVSAMTSAQNPHGGQESTLLGFYTSLMHWGAIIVPPGFTSPNVAATGGNPYGFSRVAQGSLSPEETRAISDQAHRLARAARALRTAF